MTTSALPHLLYIGDVPIESSYHGSALIYRLLQNYPTEKLLIVEAGFEVSQSERRLPGVSYIFAQHPGGRWLRTRFNRVLASLYSLVAPYRLRVVESEAGSFTPEAVLTVAHGYSWITAAAYAKKHKIPLHLIIHDDWPRMALVLKCYKKLLDTKFMKIYRLANSRLCVSPYMKEEYRRRYSVDADVIYPSRAANTESKYVSTTETINRPLRPLTFAFAGTINSTECARSLELLAKCIKSISGRLIIYAPVSWADVQLMGINGDHVECRGMLSSADLIKQLHNDADVLYVPMSFLPHDRENSMLSFPSKLTDYTAMGLAILIRGPEYSSAVRWAKDNKGVAEVVIFDSELSLSNAIARLNDPIYRKNLALKALTKGNEYFSHFVAEKTFYSKLENNATI